MAAKAPFLSAENLSKQFGARPLFDGLDFGIAEGDRIGLVGPNGSGKSTLLRVLARQVEPDGGSLIFRRGIRVGYVPQDPVLPEELSAEEALMAAFGDLPLEEFEKMARVGIWLGRLGFADPDQKVSALSGGWRKRLAIGCELVKEPDVLLLDEPTNHLDVEGILELEEILAAEPAAFVVVSHDRYFLENIARRMLELDRVYPEGLLQVDGKYSDLLEKRDELRRNQADYQESLANRARRELEWLRRGPKARTTKAKARIDEAHRLMDELAEVKGRQATGAAGIDFSSSGRKTKRLLHAQGVGKSYDGQTVLRGVDLLLGPGTRLGVLGANGSGKSTLLAILAGTLEPDAGTVDRAPLLRTVYFEQSRASLDRTVSLKRALVPQGGDSVIYQGRPIHVASWARRFLFRSEQLETPVSQLSGGEQARILIARLMLEPADLLILDEPTNDLDIPTLEVLEESLLEFPGALVLVTHDRYLLDRVSTGILALEGGRPRHFAELSQWAEHREAAARRPATKTPPAPAKSAVAPAKAVKKLSFAEQKEFDGLEKRILTAEAIAAEHQAAVSDPAVATDASRLNAACLALEAARREIDELYHRWTELEEKRGA
jgi:ATP-binding cassette subfamily F protein uup